MKKISCPYFELNDLERAYHDKEWGTPCRNDRRLFEYLMYEVLQCGPVGVVHADNVNGTLCEFFVLGRSTFSGKIKHG